MTEYWEPEELLTKEWITLMEVFFCRRAPTLMRDRLSKLGIEKCDVIQEAAKLILIRKSPKKHAAHTVVCCNVIFAMRDLLQKATCVKRGGKGRGNANAAKIHKDYDFSRFGHKIRGRSDFRKSHADLWFDDIISSLTDHQKQLLRMRFVTGLHNGEICKSVGISRETARTRIMEALDALVDTVRFEFH